MSVTIASFKINARERRVRVVPERGEDGCPFEGPGVDLLGEDARDVIARAEPILAWLRAREPDVDVRSLSIDVRRQRVLVTAGGGAKPRVIRIDPPASLELIDEARPLMDHLGSAVLTPLRRRRT
jgi:hypothetical protein